MLTPRFIAIMIAKGLWPVALAVGASAVMINCPSPQPAPTGVDASVPNVQDQAVYAELVEAGCLATASDGPQSVAGEHALGTSAWLNCLYVDGGTIASCAVPCSSAIKLKR